MKRLVGVGVVLLATASIGAAVAATDPTPTQVRAILARLGIEVRAGDRAYRVPSSAMEPTLHCAHPGAGCRAITSDRIIVRAYGEIARPRRGDIVAFVTPPLAQVRCGVGGTFVKRIIGLPGDRVAERNGVVFVNGRRLREPYVVPGYRDYGTISPARVPLDAYYVLGDNRLQSCDSRAWGSVRRRSIIGRALAIYWPSRRARRL